MKRVYKFLFLLVLLHTSGSLRAQNGFDRFWYFGNQAGLDFSSNPPAPLLNGAMSAFEGCATISDAAGNLLFYTNGKEVWNRNHSPMPGGSGLNGDGAATQTAIIVPIPQNPSRYYIFTVDTNGGPRGLNYSEVDMSLDGGLGDVSVKNVPLITPVTEKLTAIRHANGIDVWLMVHGWNNSDFYAFRITPTGISTTPVTTNIGAVHGGNFANSHGYLKASPDAQKVACAIRGLRQTEVFDFNNITGVLSNALTLNFTPQVYGLEFSSDNRFLYIGTTSNPGEIFQYDLAAGSPAAVIASGQSIGTVPGLIGALQLAPNGKIYVCQFQSTSLAEIQQPGVAGSAAGFIPASLSLGGRSSGYGLPNFIQNFFIVADFSYQDTCSGLATNFTTIFPAPDSVRWNFDDPASGTANFSTLINPQHVFAQGGSFDVQLVVWQGLLSDTVTKTIQIISTPDPDLGADITTCSGNLITLNPGSFPGADFLWQDNSTNSTLDITASGTYWVKVETDGCTGADTMNAVFNPLPIVDLGNNITACQGQLLTLDAGNPGASYLWQNGATTQSITVSSTGSYSVIVTLNSCAANDNVFITFDPAPQVAFGPDTTLCKGFPIFLDATNPGASYTWNTGVADPFIFVDSAGTYSVIVSINTCTASDTITIDQQDKPLVFLGEDSILCAGQPIVLDAFNYGAVYQWQDSSTNATFSPGITGTYFVTAVNQCGISADSINLIFNVCNCLVYIPDAFSPNRDTKNEVFNYRYNCTDFVGKLEIYNRFGQLVFASEDPDAGWDGNFKGQEAPAGAYIYVLKYKGYDNGVMANEKLRGSFLLLR